MSTESVSKRMVQQLGCKLIVTDIDIRQRILPARVEFKGIEQVIQVDPQINEVTLEFEGYESRCNFSDEESCAQARYIVATEVADMLEADGVIVIGRPAE